MDQAGYEAMGDIVADMRDWRYGTPPAGTAERPPTYMPLWLYVTPAIREETLVRQKAVLAKGYGDPALSVVAAFEETVLINALFCGDLDTARALVDARFPPDAVARGDVMDSAHKVQSMAVCVRAVLDQDAHALALMEGLARESDSQFWRFNIFRDDAEDYFARCGRTRWLDRLARTEAYRVILNRYMPRWMHACDRFSRGPLRMVEDATLGGKAKKKCDLSGEKIAPGTDIVRYRLAFEGEVNGMQMASRAAFEESPLQSARTEFEANTVPFADMFPPLADVRDYIHDPKIARFYQDMADGIDFDPVRAAHLITRPDRKPISYRLEGEGRIYEQGLPDYHGADGHGEAGRLLWRLIRCGRFEAVADAAAALPDADAFFALAACFEDDGVAARAARHFDLPDLPAMVALALKGRARPKVAMQLADYGAAHPRWRSALALAMDRYALNLYSSYVPSVNWFYAGWDRFSRAYGTSLMYFCADTPDDIPALAHMLRARKLIGNGGSAGAQCYSDCGPLFYQAALLHLHRNDRAALTQWLDAEWMTKRMNGPAEAAMRKFVAG